MSAAEPIRTLLVDDDPLFLQALIALLAADERIEIVGTASNGKEAVDSASLMRPDIVTMDIAMPIMDGVEATRQIIERLSRTRIVLVSSSDDADRAEAARRVGASAYVTKSRAVDLLVETIVGVSLRAREGAA